MRKQPGPTALLAVLTMLATLLVAHLFIITTTASAAGRAPAPPTPENFERLRMCESGGDYARRGRRYFGAYQFSPRTWRSLGYHGLPNHAAPEVQDEAAVRLQDRDGWRPWPACSRRLKLR
jgi:hypothetical protein